MKKTNAARLLDRLGIDYELLEYRVDEQDLSAEHVAQELDLPAEQVFKTIVLRGDKTGVFVCCIPGNGELDLKGAARVTGNKKVELVPLKEILALTGYVRGGCSPLAMKKQYPTFLDSRALDFDFIVVSAGVRGLQLKLAPHDLAAASRAKVGELIIS
ncbi:MAG: Cys-tRNA(Pro) deacylase [Bacillota bacterium]|jgi:Cys-tRNA(Pro)/Cys-tRNA(Cys) deacylase|nr:Cys-tRNA(Pro) deacylase [Bacillota bacterium]NLJ03154.1 Cys-tRNA(Pro) deacylase [Bacillota bacterium]